MLQSAGVLGSDLMASTSTITLFSLYNKQSMNSSVLFGFNAGSGTNRVMIASQSYGDNSLGDYFYFGGAALTYSYAPVSNVNPVYDFQLNTYRRNGATHMFYSDEEGFSSSTTAQTVAAATSATLKLGAPLLLMFQARKARW